MYAQRPGLCLVSFLASLALASSAWSHPGAGIAVDDKGNVYFVHGIRDRILKVDATGKVTTFVEGAKGKGFTNPHHLVLDGKGNLYAASDSGGRVWKVTPDGKVTQFYPPPNGPGIDLIGSGGDPFTVDPEGNVYCTHYRQFKFCQILKVGADGRLSSLAGGDWGDADGKAAQAQFRNLHGAAFAWASDGALLVTDNGSRVRRVTPDGTVTTVAGAKEGGFADGPSKEARFRGAMGLAVDAGGNILVADGGNRRVRKITPEGKVSTLAGSGKRGGDDGPALEATFEDPTGVAVGGDGTVYVLDFVGDHPRVRKLGSDGKVTTVTAVVPAQADRVDDYLKAEMAKRHIPGLSVGVLRDGQVVKARGYGLANVEFSAPATEETVYNLASVTHAFTGTAVMMLVEEGKISLDEKASKYLPDLPSAWGGVTVRHLLSHTSGLPDYVNVSGAASERRAEEVVKKLAPLPAEFLPGEKWAYNQTGYVLLGMIVEKVAGVSYPRFVEDRILKPLGMAATRFGGDRDVIKNLNPTWYTWENGALGRTGGISYPTWAYPGAGLTSTVTDLAKFDAALSAEKLLKKASLEQMWGPAKLNSGEKAGGKVLGYGLGWAIIDHRGLGAVGHGGGTNNWIVHFVDDKLTVIVLCNLFKTDALTLAKGVADLYLGPAQATENKKP